MKKQANTEIIRDCANRDILFPFSRLNLNQQDSNFGSVWIELGIQRQEIMKIDYPRRCDRSHIDTDIALHNIDLPFESSYCRA